MSFLDWIFGGNGNTVSNVSSNASSIGNTIFNATQAMIAAPNSSNVGNSTASPYAASTECCDWDSITWGADDYWNGETNSEETYYSISESELIALALSIVGMFTLGAIFGLALPSLTRRFMRRNAEQAQARTDVERVPTNDELPEVSSNFSLGSVQSLSATQEEQEASTQEEPEASTQEEQEQLMPEEPSRVGSEIELSELSELSEELSPNLQGNSPPARLN